MVLRTSACNSGCVSSPARYPESASPLPPCARCGLPDEFTYASSTPRPIRVWWPFKTTQRLEPIGLDLLRRATQEARGLAGVRSNHANAIVRDGVGWQPVQRAGIYDHRLQ